MHGSLAVQSVVLVESGWVVGLVGLRTHLVDVFVFECHVSPPHPNWYFVLTTFRELLSPIMYGLPCHIVRYPIDIYLVELPVVVWVIGYNYRACVLVGSRWFHNSMEDWSVSLRQYLAVLISLPKHVAATLGDHACWLGTQGLVAQHILLYLVKVECLHLAWAVEASMEA